jgi:phytoene synthase
MSAATGTLLLTEDLRDAVEYCREVTRTRAANFYWGLRLTPEPQRSAMYAIYAWMREADDIVDGASAANDAAQSIQAFRVHTRLALLGEVAEPTSLWRALAAVARAYPLVMSDFEAMIDGQIADLRPQRLQRETELRQYCEQVASSVGRVCVRVWGYQGKDALALASERGVAFQMVNVIRDVAEDARMGRIYIPQERFDDAGVDLDGLLHWREPSRCLALIEGMIKAARDRFEASTPLESMIEPTCRPTLRGLTGMYRALLERLAADPERVVRQRVSVPTLQKALVIFRARLAGRR